jgi:BASS family bile acid:Na+ symporter
MVALICASVMARSAEAAQQANLTLLLAIFGLHAGGFLLGYVASKVLGMPEPTARTNSIEVGMQNSTLGASLAMMHFIDPLVAVPCAISACMHSILGSLIAGVWRFTDKDTKGDVPAAAV